MKVGDLVTSKLAKFHKQIYGTIVSKRTGNLGHTMVYQVHWFHTPEGWSFNFEDMWWHKEDLEIACKQAIQ